MSTAADTPPARPGEVREPGALHGPSDRRASAVLAEDLHAELHVIATGPEAVFLDRGEPGQRSIVAAHPDALDPRAFPAGSIGPEVAASAQFARQSGNPAVIGSLEQLSSVLDGHCGTRISVQAEGMETR